MILSFHFLNTKYQILYIKYLGIYLPICLFVYLLISFPVYASLPSSASYKLDGYSFGAGGTANNTASSNYGLSGTAGEVEFGRPSSSSYKAGSGLTYLLASNVPGAPTLSTPGNNYDRIQFVLNTSSNPSDITYALQISTSSNFSTGVNYIKSDGTIGPSLATTDFKTYTNWGGASGSFVTGLASNTTYYIRAKARQGSYSESDWGPSSSITTQDPSLTFSLDTNTLTFNNLNAGNAYTDSSQTNTLTTSTNAYNGYVVYGKVTQPLTDTEGATIANYASANSSPSTWSGTGFGYTTSDTNLTGGTVNRFSGSKYAGFTTSTSGDPVADNAGPVTTSPITNEQFTISYRVTGNNLTKVGTYQTTILYSIVPSY